MSGIERETWVEMFRHGYGLGQQERHRAPENRRENVSEIHEDADYSDSELDAIQAGYEIGRDEWYPGANINIEKRANRKFDRSGNAPDLSQWGDS